MGKSHREIEMDLHDGVDNLIARAVRSEESLSTIQDEIEAVLTNMPQQFIVRVREGNGSEDVAATLAVSVALLVQAWEKLYVARSNKGG